MQSCPKDIENVQIFCYLHISFGWSVSLYGKQGSCYCSPVTSGFYWLRSADAGTNSAVSLMYWLLFCLTGSQTTATKHIARGGGGCARVCVLCVRMCVCVRQGRKLD